MRGVAQAFVHVVLQEAQQLDLHAQGHVTDLVQEHRAALGGGDTAGVVAHGVGEGARLVAEQLGFEQGFGQRSAVDGDERMAVTRTEVVNGAGQQRLARARLAVDQHAAFAAGDGGQNIEDVRHVRIVRHDTRKRMTVLRRRQQLLDPRQIAKRRDAADDLAVVIMEKRTRHRRGHAPTSRVGQVHGEIDHGLARLHRTHQVAAIPADAAADHFMTRLPQRFVPTDAKGPFRGVVEGDDAPLAVDGEYPVRGTVEQHLQQRGRHMAAEMRARRVGGAIHHRATFAEPGDILDGNHSTYASI